MSEIISTRDLCKTYRSRGGRLDALKNVSFSVSAGEFVAVLGSSGSGKSTLMNILGCLDTPSSGSYRLCGVEVSRLSPKQLSLIRRRTIGFVFQRFMLLPTLTALENVELPLVYMGIPAGARRQRAAAALESVGLSERLAHLPGELSGGQQQRVAFARAVVTAPRLILADEPTGNLDSRSGGQVLRLLREQHEQGRTIILITHDEKTAAAASRRVAVFDGVLSE